MASSNLCGIMASTVTSKRPSKESELYALRRAIDVERRARYSDFQGKHSTFSKFMCQTADRLCRAFPADIVWTTIRGLFRPYSNLDVGTRISVVRRAEELLEPYWRVSASEQSAGAAPASTAVTNDMGVAAAPRSGTDKPDYIERTETPGTSPSAAMGRPNAGAAAVHAKAPTGAVARPKLTQAPEDVPVQFVKGVGPRGAAVLSKLGIVNLRDLLKHYPKRHLDFKNRLRIKDLQEGQEVTIFGDIKSVNAYQTKRGNMSVISILISDGTGSITVTRFVGGRSNRYLMERYKNQYPKGAQVLASGVTERDNYGHKLALKNAEIELLGHGGDPDEEDPGAPGAELDQFLTNSIHAGRLVPVYPLTEGISLRHLRNIMFAALEALGTVSDPLPEAIRQTYGLADLDWSIRTIHFPDDVESKDRARHRLVFDELFSVQLQLAHRRYNFEKTEGALSISLKENGLVDRLRQSLPFTLTNAQERVFKQIANDLASAKPLHRLVQGDVGSGKTIVALMAALVAIENGFQCAIMAPTEILAEQHCRQFQRLLTPLGLRCCLVLGKQGAKERRLIRQELLSGQVHIAVGTHALIVDDVEFHNLGLIIIDEQHRFGVKQRARLKAKSLSPELLTMTATPIPRTLALTIHGDLDVSEIDEMPPGRKPIETKLCKPGQKNGVWEFILKQVEAGRQAYVVFPLIDESETLSAKAATIEFAKLTERYKDQLRIGLMHGKLKSQEKDEVMEKFRDREFDILVCTTVIEVGVDVPNASVMVIENADRFGLAALHQLRGRVGRGAEQSYCFLVSDSRADATRQRLEILTQTNDGFVVAQKDLEIRGPGEFLGYRQSGLPDLVLADLVKDAKILEQARHAAIDLIKNDPELNNHASLKKMLVQKASTAESEIMRSG